MRKIEELSAVCGVLLAYVSEKKDLLDEKMGEGTKGNERGTWDCGHYADQPA